jgi:hypothetical protein
MKNLARLKRSVVKLWPKNADIPMQVCWQALADGYDD